MRRVLLAALLALGSGVNGAEFHVNTLADGNDGGCDPLPDTCTLREAMLAAESSGGPDSILFDQLPGTAPWRISPDSGLPNLSDGQTLVDGWSAPGFAGQPLIEIQGPSTITNGLRILGNGVVIRGLAFMGFTNQVNMPLSTSQDIRIQGNIFGADSQLSMPAGPSGNGISMLGSGHVIGTDGDGVNDDIEGNLFLNAFTAVFVNGVVAGANSSDNRISGNTFGLDNMPNGFGVVLNANTVTGTVIGRHDSSLDADRDGNQFGWHSQDAIFNNGAGTVIRGNRIGVAADGTTPTPNAGLGIRVSNGQGHVIGGTLPGEENVIAHGGSNGVLITGASARARIGTNQIHSNARNAIKFTLTDSPRSTPDLLDMDTGANELQNYPVLSDPARLLADRLLVSGSLLAQPSRNYRLDFYVSRGCQADGGGDAELAVASFTLDADPAGDLFFDLDLPPVDAGLFPALSVTATDNVDEVTSEVSDCVAIDDLLFQDSFE